MRTHRPLLLLLACLVVASSLPAQESSSSSTTSVAPATSDPQAVALVQQALAVLTGGVAMADVTLTGTARSIAGSDDESGAATLTALATGDSKLSMTFPSGGRIEIRNPSTSSTGQAGAWSGPDGTMHLMAVHNLFTDPTWFFPAFTLGTVLSSQNEVLVYHGLETHNGQSLLHISAWEEFPQLSPDASTTEATPETVPNAFLQRISQMEFFFDPNSMLPVALDFTEHSDSDASIDIATEIRFSNYQGTSGVLVPMHLQKYLNNSLELDLQCTNASFNSGLSSSAFAIQ